MDSRRELIRDQFIKKKNRHLVGLEVAVKGNGASEAGIVLINPSLPDGTLSGGQMPGRLSLVAFLCRSRPWAALTKMADFAIALDFESSGFLLSVLSVFPERYP